MNQVSLQTTIEARLIETCAALGAAFSLVGVVANAVLEGDPLLVTACAASTLGFLLVLLASRRGAGIRVASAGFFGVAAFLLLSTWEVNGGVRGSTSVAIPGAAVLAVLTLPYRRSVLALACVLAFFLGLCMMELYDGEPAELPFQGMAGAADSMVTTISTTVIAAAAVAVMRNRYEDALTQLSIANSRIEELAASAVAADQDKSRFMARMSHDLRTPLAAVLGSIDLALANPARGDIAALLRAARERSNDLERLVADLVDVESHGSGALPLVEKPVRLTSWLNMLRAEARPRDGIVVELVCDPDLPAWARFDTTRVGQVVANLLDNACKHTDSGRIVLSADSVGGLLRIAVMDTGPGMADDELASVGSPYCQTERGRERGGHGLGLFSAKQIARLLHGNLWIESRPGSGTRVQLEIPLVAATPGSAVPETPGRLAMPMKVLFADDEPVLREIMAAMLESIGCTVVAADSGLQALLRAAESEFDAVLLDIVMDGLDGHETARRLRAQFPTLPLIAMTANAYPQDVRTATEAGFDLFLAKPVTTAQLVDALTQVSSRLARAADT